jgi:hypothetical protein
MSLEIHDTIKCRYNSYILFYPFKISNLHLPIIGNNIIYIKKKLEWLIDINNPFWPVSDKV